MLNAAATTVGELGRPSHIAADAVPEVTRRAIVTTNATKAYSYDVGPGTAPAGATKGVHPPQGPLTTTAAETTDLVATDGGWSLILGT